MRIEEKKGGVGEGSFPGIVKPITDHSLYCQPMRKQKNDWERRRRIMLFRYSMFNQS
jgi:hypothetical protein